MSQIKKKERLTIDVSMDDNLIPESIEWKSSQENKPSQTASAALIYFWDAKKNETFNLDLWTKEMSVEEMNKMMFQTLDWFKSPENFSLNLLLCVWYIALLA